MSPALNIPLLLIVLHVGLRALSLSLSTLTCCLSLSLFSSSLQGHIGNDFSSNDVVS